MNFDYFYYPKFGASRNNLVFFPNRPIILFVMLLNVKYDFYKGCDQYPFKLLLGPLQIFGLHDASVFDLFSCANLHSFFLG